jgi:hypothetical protein
MISLNLFHFQEKHKIEQLAGCTLERAVLRGGRGVKINQQKCSWVLVIEEHTSHDVHGSVHHNTNLIEMTSKMHLCRRIN